MLFSCYCWKKKNDSIWCRFIHTSIPCRGRITACWLGAVWAVTSTYGSVRRAADRNDLVVPHSRLQWIYSLKQTIYVVTILWWIGKDKATFSVSFSCFCFSWLRLLKQTAYMVKIKLHLEPLPNHRTHSRPQISPEKIELAGPPQTNFKHQLYFEHLH